jgi:hypothetical protein
MESNEAVTSEIKVSDEHIEAYASGHAGGYSAESKVLGVEAAMKAGASDGKVEARKAFKSALRTAFAGRKA